MRLSESQINVLGKQYIERLKKAQSQLGTESPSLGEIQMWMIKNQVESPELLETVLRTIGPGKKAGKKNLP